MYARVGFVIIKTWTDLQLPQIIQTTFKHHQNAPRVLASLFLRIKWKLSMEFQRSVSVIEATDLTFSAPVGSAVSQCFCVNSIIKNRV